MNLFNKSKFLYNLNINIQDVNNGNTTLPCTLTSQNFLFNISLINIGRVRHQHYTHTFHKNNSFPQPNNHTTNT